MHYSLSVIGLIFKVDEEVKKVKFEFTSVNLKRMRNHDPFVLASQVEEVFYIPDMKQKGLICS